MYSGNTTSGIIVSKGLYNMTQILEIFLCIVGIIGCVCVGLAAVLIFNINLRTFGSDPAKEEHKKPDDKRSLCDPHIYRWDQNEEEKDAS